MTAARGMTLIEVLLSLTLMGALGLVLLPLMLEIRLTAEDAGVDPELYGHLSILADEFMREPSLHGWEIIPERCTLSLVINGVERPVDVQRLHEGSSDPSLDPSSGEPSDHSWILFECGELCLSRFVRAASGELPR